MAIEWSAVKAIKIPEGDCKRVAINGTIVWEKGLPSEYQQVDYIESTGTQYINTGVIGKTGLHIVAEMGYATATSLTALFGSRGTREQRFFVTVYPQNRFDFGYAQTDVQSGIVIESRKICNIDFDTSTHPSRFGIDGVYVESSNQVNTGRYVYIFGYNNNGVKASLSKSIFKSMTIADENGELFRNFVPCYRKQDGEIGMYDLVNGVFYTNSGSGTFIKGEDV
jgi:hypothetical protein